MKKSNIVILALAIALVFAAVSCKDPSHEHTPVVDAAAEATCATGGKIEGSHCSVCGEVLKAQETVAADPANHVGETEYRVLDKPGYFTKGMEYECCKGCDKKMSDKGKEIPVKKLSGYWESDLILDEEGWLSMSFMDDGKASVTQSHPFSTDLIYDVIF